MSGFLSAGIVGGPDIPDSVVYDFETGDTSRWDYSAHLSADNSRAQSGTYGGYVNSYTEGSAQAYADTYETQQEIASFEFYFNETSNSQGSGIRLYNGSGNAELGLGTDNPQWVIQDNNGTSEIYSGDGYDRWVRCKATFDWGSNTFDVTFEDLQSGTTKSSTDRPLRQGNGVKRVQLENYKGGVWVGSYDPYSVDVWYDDIEVIL